MRCKIPYLLETCGYYRHSETEVEYVPKCVYPLAKEDKDGKADRCFLQDMKSGNGKANKC